MGFKDRADREFSKRLKRSGPGYKSRSEVRDMARSAASSAASATIAINILKGLGIFLLAGLVIGSVSLIIFKDLLKAVCPCGVWDDSTYYERGKVYLTCKICEKNKQYEAHLEETIIKEATCCEEGLAHQVWTVPEDPDLNAEFDVVIKEIAHDFQFYADAVEPTCSSVGYTETEKCSMCGTEAGHKEIPKTSHNLVYIDPLEPTCEQPGHSKYSYCQDCDMVFTKKEVIDPLGHNLSSVVTNETYTTYGYTTHTCSRCDYVCIDTFIEPTAYADFNFNIEDNQISYVSSKKELETLNSIPETLEVLIDGNLYTYPITKISGSAFKDSTIKSVIIPDHITQIGNSAFENCQSLTSITFHNNITSIGDNAFAECKGLTNVVLPDSLTYLGKQAF